MPKTLNIAVIGAGTMAQAVHLPLLRRRWDRFAISALVDHSARRRRESAEVWGISEDARYESVEDLISAVRAKTLELDAALLATDGLHVESLLALLGRGIPVLVEPPLGFSAEEVDRIASFERMMGRPMVMMAYPQQYDDVVPQLAEHVRTRDIRMFEHEVLMPASQALFGHAHVTSSAYDLPADVRKERRKALQAAVIDGTGGGATQRDRDLYVKGLLSGVAHQLAVLEHAYGPVEKVVSVRHWPKGVIPGSLEILGELAGGEPVRLAWHYLPFAPQYSERVRVLSARRRLDLDLAAPSHSDERSTFTRFEKEKGTLVETTRVAGNGSAEAMWEAFHAFVDKGTEPLTRPADEITRIALLRQILVEILAADGRSLEPEPDTEGEAESEPEAESEAETGGAVGPEAGTGGEGEQALDEAVVDEGAEVALEEDADAGAEQEQPTEDDAAAGDAPSDSVPSDDAMTASGEGRAASYEGRPPSDEDTTPGQ